ncbi:MAG: Lrp/AsnC ligand binding domain-containing protein [Dehalococcoidia bacterium]
MATKAFVLIETAVGKTREVVEAMKSVPGVTSVDAVTGPYDIIAVLEAEDLNTIGEMVTSKVHTVGSVVRTVTCLAVSLP